MSIGRADPALIVRAEADSPLAMAWRPDDENAYIAEKRGVLVAMSADYQLREIWDFADQVSSNGEQAMITGDVVINPAQVTHPEWVLGFDSDPAAGIATRTALLDRIESEGLRMLTCHFPAPGAGTIIRLDGQRFFRGAELS